MKKIFRPTIANFFLIVYCSYLLFSCSFQVESNKNFAVLKSIQKKIKKKDFKNDVIPINPFKAESKITVDFVDRIAKKYELRPNKSFQRSNTMYSKTKSFARLVSNTEYLTMGFDVEENYYRALNEMTYFASGSIDYATLSTELQQANNFFINYQFTYSGVTRFFQDLENSGLLTQSQRAIIETELNALLDLNSIEEAIQLNHMITYEVMNSEMSDVEKNKILQTTALIDNMLHSNTFAKAKATNDGEGCHFTAWGAAGFIGLGIMIVGIVMYKLGVDNSITSHIIVGGFILFALGAWM